MFTKSSVPSKARGLPTLASSAIAQAAHRLHRTMLLINLLLTPAMTPPHLIMMVIDDLGWTDVGYHNSVRQRPFSTAAAAAAAAALLPLLCLF